MSVAITAYRAGERNEWEQIPADLVWTVFSWVRRRAEWSKCQLVKRTYTMLYSVLHLPRHQNFQMALPCWNASTHHINLLSVFRHKNKLCYFTMKSDKTSNTWTKPKWYPKYYIKKCSSHCYKMHFLYEIDNRAQDVFGHMSVILTIIKYVMLHCDTVHYLCFHECCPATECPT